MTAPDLTADDLRALASTEAQREILEWALGAAIPYQEEQREPGTLDDGEEPISLAEDTIYRMTEQFRDMDPEVEPEHTHWKKQLAAGKALAKKIAAAIGEAA